jgi:hypothetical protein
MPRSIDRLADRLVGQLVVGSARDHLDLQARQGRRRDRAAQGAGCEHIGVDVEDGVGRDDPGAGLGGHLVQGLLVDVGDDQLGAGGVQLLGQIGADVAYTLDGDGDAVQIAVQGPLDAQPHAAEHALGGDRRRVARGGGVAFQAGDILGGAAGGDQVGRRDADVLGRPVLAGQAVDGAAEGLEQLRRLLAAGVANDHGLAAAEVQVCHGVLVRHALRQPQGVGHSSVGAGIVPHAAAASGRTARGGVDGDNRLQAGFFVKERVYAFVSLEIRESNKVMPKVLP